MCSEGYVSIICIRFGLPITGNTTLADVEPEKRKNNDLQATSGEQGEECQYVAFFSPRIPLTLI